MVAVAAIDDDGAQRRRCWPAMVREKDDEEMKMLNGLEYGGQPTIMESPEKMVSGDVRFWFREIEEGRVQEREKEEREDLPAFITKVVNQIAINLKAIHDTGIHRVMVANLQPIGCLPQETISSSYQQCKENRNTAASFHNKLLQQAVTTLNNNTKASTFLILDNFSAFNTVFTSKGDLTGNIKFDAPYKPCCIGTRSGVHCGNVDENGKELYTVCEKPESMFFWDMVHPSQAGWRAVYLALRPSLNQMYN